MVKRKVFGNNGSKIWVKRRVPSFKRVFHFYWSAFSVRSEYIFYWFGSTEISLFNGTFTLCMTIVKSLPPQAVRYFQLGRRLLTILRNFFEMIFSQNAKIKSKCTIKGHEYLNPSAPDELHSVDCNLHPNWCNFWNKIFRNLYILK